MRLTIAAIASLTVGSIAPAAYSQSAPGGFTAPVVRPATTRSAQMRAMDQFNNDERARRRAAAEEARQMAERRSRAERLAALANSGHCDEAVRIARAENDPDMANRLVAACTPANPVAP